MGWRHEVRDIATHLWKVDCHGFLPRGRGMPPWRKAHLKKCYFPWPEVFMKWLRCFLVLISSASDVPPDQAVLMAEARELFLGDDLTLSRSDVMSGQNQTFSHFLIPARSVQYGHFSFFHVFPGLFRHIPSVVYFPLFTPGSHAGKR